MGVPDKETHGKHSRFAKHLQWVAGFKAMVGLVACAGRLGIDLLRRDHTSCDASQPTGPNLPDKRRDWWKSWYCGR